MNYVCAASRLCTVFLAILLLCGCASSGYLANRRRDAADIVTISVGSGIGAKARIGPVGTGVLLDSPEYGVRGGDWLTKSNFGNPGKPIPVNSDLQLLILGQETFLGSCKVQERGKAFTVNMICGLNIPRLTDLHNLAKAADREVHQVAPLDLRYFPWPYLTQIEAVIGLGASLRIGFNPGELLDFILGWAGLDLFRDDVEKETTTQRASAERNRL
jgi:hypothetical protein